MECIGVDLGGTNLRAARIEASTGAVLAASRCATLAGEGHDAVIARIAEQIETVRSKRTRYVGIGVPGLYDPATDCTRFLPNLPGTWPGVPLGPEIGRRTGMKTKLVNDARAFVLAEAAFGAGKGADCVAGLTLGTGIGGGLVIKGKLIFGHDGTAGEIGHQIVDRYGPLCGCGARGCLESLVSAPLVAAAGARAVLQGRTTLLRERSGGNLNTIDVPMIVAAAQAGDDCARHILCEAGTWLGLGIANVVTVFSPDVVVLGGGMAEANEWLLGPIRETIRDRCRVTPIERVQVLQSQLSGSAGVIGAALWAAQHQLEQES